MKNLHIGLTVAAIAAVFSVATVTLSAAAPIYVPTTVTAQSDLIQVGHNKWRYGHYNGYRAYRYRPAYRYNYGGGAFIAGALIGSVIANNGYYGNNYYGNGYYGGGYNPGGYYGRRVYYPPRAGYRQGYADGYRAGFNDGAYGGGITCTQRLADAGKC